MRSRASPPSAPPRKAAPHGPGPPLSARSSLASESMIFKKHSGADLAEEIPATVVRLTVQRELKHRRRVIPTHNRGADVGAHSPRLAEGHSDRAAGAPVHDEPTLRLVEPDAHGVAVAVELAEGQPRIAEADAVDRRHDRCENAAQRERPCASEFAFFSPRHVELALQHRAAHDLHPERAHRFRRADPLVAARTVWDSRRVAMDVRLQRPSRACGGHFNRRSVRLRLHAPLCWLRPTGHGRRTRRRWRRRRWRRRRRRLGRRRRAWRRCRRRSWRWARPWRRGRGQRHDPCDTATLGVKAQPAKEGRPSARSGGARSPGVSLPPSSLTRMQKIVDCAGGLLQSG
jgi:hypothetical protein